MLLSIGGHRYRFFFDYQLTFVRRVARWKVVHIIKPATDITVHVVTKKHFVKIF